MTKTTHNVKYKETIDAYKATQHRSTFAIRKELTPGVEKVVTAAGANSLSDLISCLATYPEEAGALLRSIVDRATITKRPTRSQAARPLVNKLAHEATQEELAAFLTQLRATRVVSQKD